MRGTQFETTQWGISWRLILVAAMILALVGAMFTAAIPNKASGYENGDTWVYKVTYKSEITRWTETIVGEEDSGGVPCYVIETNFDSTPSRKMAPPLNFITITINQGGLTWRAVSSHDYIVRYQEAVASLGGLAKNYIYYENFSGAHGYPLSFGQSWNYDLRVDSDNNMGDSTTPFSAEVAGALETVTVPAGTFSCYKVTHTGSGKTYIEYWDSTGTFDSAPIKVVDTYNFDELNTMELEQYPSTGQPTTFNLDVTSSTGGSVTDPGEGAHGPYDAATVVNLVASPDAGFEFDGWTGDTGDIADASAASTTITMNADYAVTANFVVIPQQPTQYNLTVASSAGGTVTNPGEGSQGPYDSGTQVNLEATPDAGFMFNGWTGDTDDIADINAASTTITMNGEYSITANFVELVQYNLTVASGDNGSVTDPGEGAHGPYDGGTQVNLVATPDAGYMFNEWTGDTDTIADVNAASTTITMNGDYSITASFAEMVQYSLTVASGDNGSVTDPEEGVQGPYNGGSQVNLVATPDAGYVFAGWTGDTGAIADVNAASTTITMNSDYSITANFDEAPESWNCPIDHVALIAPYPGAGRAAIGSTIQIADMSFSGEWFMILKLNEDTGAWSTYYSGFTTGNTLTELEPGNFYYVVVSEPGSLSL